MTTINLLPDDYMLKRAQQRANVFIAVLFTVVMGSIISASVVSEESNHHTQEARDRVNKSYEEASKLINQVQQLEVKRSILLTKAKHSAMLVEKVPRSYLLALVANAMPKGTSIVKFELDAKQLVAGRNQIQAAAKGVRKGKAPQAAAEQPSEAPPAKVEVKITGLAVTDVDVAKFITNLASNVLVDTVDLVYSEEKVIEKVAVREFQVKLDLKPNADVLQLRDSQRQQPATGEEKEGTVGS